MRCSVGFPGEYSTVMIHTAHLVCRLEALNLFEAALTQHARTSLEREPGCLRFDVYREASDATLFFLHEVYADQAALDAHRQTEHFLDFRLKTADWVTSRTWWFWNPVYAPESTPTIELQIRWSEIRASSMMMILR